MISPRSILLLAVMSSSFAFAAAEKAADSKPDAPPAPPVPSMSEADKAKILEKVQQMQKDFERLRREVTANALNRFEGASASENAAVEFFLTCQKLIKDRTPDVSPPEQDVKNAKAAQAKIKQEIEAYQAAPGRATVLKTQLEYLVLTIQAPGLKDRGALVSRLRDMVGRAMNVVKTYTAPNAEPVVKIAPVTNTKGKQRTPPAQNRSRVEDRARQEIDKTMKQGVMGTVFAEAYNLSNYFTPADNWSDSPVNLSAIYEGFVLPWYRENKRGDMNQVWDEYIGHSAALHRCEQSDFAFGTWGITGYKTLQWKKWLDLLQYGMNRTMALDELSKMVKENPSHPDVESWISDLANIASTIQVPQVPATAEAPVEAPTADAAK